VNPIAVAATVVLSFLAALVVLVLVTLAVCGQAAVAALVSAVGALVSAVAAPPRAARADPVTAAPLPATPRRPIANILYSGTD
jgi:hypothetical protein